MTVEEFCNKHCQTCKELHCCVDFEPSCALSRKLKIELEAADARAEIVRLKGVVISQITPEPLVLSRYSATAEPAKDERDKLIEQMRVALKLALLFIPENAVDAIRLSKAALSAAERGE